MSREHPQRIPRNAPFEILKSNQKLYSDSLRLNNLGIFYYINGGVIKLLISDVIKVKTLLQNKNMTYGEARKKAEEIGLRFEKFQKIAYNINEGFFDKYLKQWEKISKERLMNSLSEDGTYVDYISKI